MLDENINPEVLPFKRALALLQSEPNRALFNVNRTSSRENMMKWVGPLHSSTTHLYENISAPTGAKSLEDAKQVASICVLRGNVHHRFFEKTGFENLYLANSYASCIRMLSNRRVSMTPLSNISSLVLRPDSETAQKLKKTDIMVMESKGFLAFSRQIPDEIINRWQDALNRIRASGRYDELVEQYLFGE